MPVHMKGFGEIISAGSSGFRHDWNTGPAEGVDVPLDGADGYLEFPGKPGSRGLSVIQQVYGYCV